MFVTELYRFYCISIPSSLRSHESKHEKRSNTTSPLFYFTQRNRVNLSKIFNLIIALLEEIYRYRDDEGKVPFLKRQMYVWEMPIKMKIRLFAIISNEERDEPRLH